MQKGAKDGGAGGADKGGGDARLAQWIALQSKTRKMETSKFEELYLSKQKGLPALMHKVLGFEGGANGGEEEDGEVEAQMQALLELCEEVGDASGWFAGGYKEMKSTFGEEWLKVERRVEAMTLLVVTREDMLDFARQSARAEEAVAPASFAGAPPTSHAKPTAFKPGDEAAWTAALGKTREQLALKRRKWGDVSESLTQWKAAGLTLAPRLITSAIDALLRAVRDSARGVVGNARGMLEAHPAPGEGEKPVERPAGERAAFSEVRELVKTALREMLETAEYARLPARAATLCLAAARELVCADCALLQRQLARGLVPSSMVQKAFDASLRNLKLLSKIESLCIGKGVRALIPAPPADASVVAVGKQELGGKVMELTDTLLRRVLETFEALDGLGRDKELMGWLVFGCGFINAVLGLVGDTKDSKVEALLASFMALESKLAK